MNIKFENVCFSYNQGIDSPEVLRNISFELSKSEIVGIVGPTGSGKTTLIELAAGFHKPVSGRILYDGVDFLKDGSIRAELYKKISVVFQFPEKQLFADTVFEDVSFAPRNQGVPDERLEEITKNSLRLVGLDYDRISGKSPFNLSGGEQRRVAIAGILATNPEIVFMDEPTAAVDYKGFECIKKAVDSLHHQGKTVVIVTHDVEIITTLATRIIALKNSSILYDGSINGFFDNEELVSSSNLEFPEVRRLVDKYKLDMDLKDYKTDSIREELKRKLSEIRSNE